MRRLFGILAVVSLFMALTVTPANAVVITKFDLTAARLIEKGRAVDLTFDVACDLQGGDSEDFDVTLYAEVQQRVGKTTVTASPGESTYLGCSGGTVRSASITVYLGVPKPKFRPKSALVTATVSICDFESCTSSTITEVIRLSKKGR